MHTAYKDTYNILGRTNAQKSKCYMYVLYDPIVKKYFLKATGWIELPDGYDSCDLEGTITGNVFSGSIVLDINSM